MGSLVVPVGKLVVGYPQADGMVYEFGYSRDWRPDENWQMQNAEYIEPLGAVAPGAQLVPRDMDEWSVVSGYNANVRTVYPDWVAQAASRQFTDGRVYTSYDSTSASWLQAGAWSEDLALRFLLAMVRNVPPPEQGIGAQIGVEAPCLWFNRNTGNYDSARIGITWPLAGTIVAQAADRTAPVVYMIRDADRPEGGVWDLWDYATVLTKGPDMQGAQQGAERDVWAFEWQASEVRGSWLLIRSVASADRWWSYYHPYLLPTTGAALKAAGRSPACDGRWTMTVAGAVTAWNISPLLYTNYAAVMRPSEQRLLYLPDAWSTTVSYGARVTGAEGWAVSATGDGTRPTITAQVSSASTAYRYERPVVWYGKDLREEAIGYAEADTDSTEDDATLLELSYRKTQDFRGSGGSALFRRGENIADARYDADPWMENSKVSVYLGWSDDAAAALRETLVATAYIPRNGMRRVAEGGSIGPHFSCALEDAWAARIDNTDVINLMQAGGHSVGNWLVTVGHRLGFPTSMIDLTDSVIYRTIPSALIPSEPSAAPVDGQSWSAHIDEVCLLCGIRVGVDKDGSGKLFVDSGPPTYYAATSTISLELDYETLDAENRIRAISNEGRTNAYRNATKITISGGRYLDSAIYYYEPLTTRQSGLGGDAWKHIRVDSVGEVARALRDFEVNFHRYTSAIEFTVPLRVDLRPDLFVQVKGVPGIDLTDEAVYQIVSHEMRAYGRNRSGSTSTFRAVMVAALTTAESVTTQGYVADRFGRVEPGIAVASGGYHIG